MASSSQPSVDSDYFEHDMLQLETIESREYQTELSEAALEKSSLVVMPTGTGKTPVALMVMAERLKQFPRGRVMMLAPTKPLVEQQAEFFQETLDIPEGEDGVKVFTGDTVPDKREAMWDDPTTRVIVATPQVVRNDLTSGRISLESVVYLIFDECHRATGDYPYTYIANAYKQTAENPLVTGLSASPGSNREEILSVCENLGLEEAHIKSEEDPEVMAYMPEKNVEYKLVEMPDELLEIRDLIQGRYVDILQELKGIGVLKKASKTTGFYQLQKARQNALDMKNDGESDGFAALSLHAEAMKLYHALGAVESQGVASLLAYFESVQRKADSGGTKADQRILSNSKIQEAWERAREYEELHPKKEQLRMYVLEEVGINEGQVIVFTESRVVVDDIVGFLNEFVSAERFVGQGNKDGSDGMTQAEQKETLDQFRDGEFDVLVTTSVAEEGLDIPTVDLVVFYEPVASAIRNIQRRGRTGRHMPGRVRILAGKGTRDEGAYWSAKRKEKGMKSDLKELKEESGDLNSALEDVSSQSSLDEYAGGEPESDVEEIIQEDVPEESELAESERSERVEAPSFEEADDTDVVQIYIDNRELNSNVPGMLKNMSDVTVSLDVLPVGDFIVSERVAIERKTWTDLLDTLTSGDRSLFDQLGDMSRNFEYPILLLEGDIDELYSRNIHDNAVFGMMASVVLSFGVYPLYTRNETETAGLIARLAHREQIKKDRTVNPHADKGSRSVSESQEYIVSSVAMNVGPKTATALLEHFGSVKAVFSASSEELQAVEGVGPKTAESFREMLDAEYES